MQSFDYEHACHRLISQIHARHFTFKPTMLEAIPEPPGFHSAFARSWLEKTLFFNLILDHFDDSIKWFNKIMDDNYNPDWHLVAVDPDTSPLAPDDWCMAATSKAEALADVIEAMTLRYVKPTHATCDDDSICIYGDNGPIARITRIQFHSVEFHSEKRAVNALSGIGLWESGPKLFKGLAKIQGLSEPNAPDPRDGHSRLKDCLYPTPNNLCTVLKNILSGAIHEKIPRNVAQELLAIFFGFENWHQFNARVKSREDAVKCPYYLIQEDRDSIGKVMAFAKGLPSGLHLFGQMLRQQSRRSYTVEVGSRWRVTNFTRNDSQSFLETGEVYQESTGLSLRSMSTVYPSNEYLYVASALIDSPSFETSLKEYLHADDDIRQRMMALNAKRGIAKGDHLFLANWCCFVKRERPQDSIWFERMDEKHPLQCIAADLYKAALKKVDGVYWLATDWDRMPKYPLPDLSDADANMIEKTFFFKENWRVNYDFSFRYSD